MNELITINAKEFGLEQTRADEIAESFREPLAELAVLENEYKNFENLTGTPPESTCDEAKILKQKYVKNRKDREKIHKTEKSYFWNAGKYVDAWKNKALEVSKERENKLTEIADHYINLEKERIEKLSEKREKELLACAIDDEMYIPPQLGNMPDEAWKTYLAGVQKAYDDEMEHRRQETLKQQAKEKAEREEQERIRKENEQLKKEAEAKEKAIAKERKAMEEKLEAERIEREKLEAEKQAKIDAERKAMEEKEEAEKKAQAAPDKIKLSALAEKINSVDYPEVITNAARRIVENVNGQIETIYNELLEEIENL